MLPYKSGIFCWMANDRCHQVVCSMFQVGVHSCNILLFYLLLGSFPSDVGQDNANIEGLSLFFGQLVLVWPKPGQWLHWTIGNASSACTRLKPSDMLPLYVSRIILRIAGLTLIPTLTRCCFLLFLRYNTVMESSLSWALSISLL